MSPASNKIALFIDGANLYATAKTLGFDIDYKRLLKEFLGRGPLIRAFYYIAINEAQEYSSIRPRRGASPAPSAQSPHEEERVETCLFSPKKIRSKTASRRIFMIPPNFFFVI